ncbi:MAG: NAD(P)-dependent glycerol-3-phosphate dehydrogenase [Leptospiraceae bacterium]|nr:NAD(P)-dependent glycerol-3-phosphate dehydrogenase [Leptospiraceae bacterium]MCP5499924.1 NAD(P)-dependent glycerol-3-phosphate dehydrogenase [Leptospiraceae bacterium]
MKVGVIGAGSFGTALGAILADKGYEVELWARSREQATIINVENKNIKHFPEIKLPKTLSACIDLEKVITGKDLIISACPSQALSSVLKDIRDKLPDAPIVSASKGIENGSLRLVSEIFEEELPKRLHKYLSYLSGPSFAIEILQKLPTVVSIASKEESIAKKVQEVFSHSYFRSYWTHDVTGVEVSGALKNVIAIAAGAADGLGFGQNTRSAIITRGLTEITRVGVKLGADPLTFLGLAGMGDLVLTCTGAASRNRTVGYKLGQGMKLSEVLDGMNEVAEGVKTSRSVHDLALKLEIELPIMEEVYKTLYEDKPAVKAVSNLMSRDLKREGVIH